MSYNRILLMFLWLHLSLVFSGYTQPGFDMAYRTESELDSFLVGKEVRIDFKGSNDSVKYHYVSEMKKYGHSERAYFFDYIFKHSDTIQIQVGDQGKIFIEDWISHYEGVVLREQLLKSLSVGDSINLYVGKQVLLSIDSNHLGVEFYFCSIGKQKYYWEITKNDSGLSNYLLFKKIYLFKREQIAGVFYSFI